MGEIITKINAFLWGWPMLIILLGVGLFMTLRLRFPFIRHFRDMVHAIVPQKDEDGVSTFAALCTAIGGQVGTGNLAGVATALFSGGPGAVFWMWIASIVGMSTIFSEAVLGQIYREKDEDGNYTGGPAYYLSKGVHSKFLSMFFAVVITIGVGVIIAMVQANSIVAGFSGTEATKSVPPLLIGVVVAVLAAVIIFGGIKKISSFASVVVPFMAIAYVVVAIFIVVKNVAMLPSIFQLIFSRAFALKAVSGGVLGYTIKQAFRFGVARGMFSNDAGQGSTPNIHAAANAKHPATQGFAAMMSIVVDSLIICSCTAFIILISDTLETGKTSVALTQVAMERELGSFGPYFILIAICFFCFTTVLADIYYGEVNLRWIFKKNYKKALVVFRIISLTGIIYSSVMTAGIIWELADFGNAMMIIPNVIALFVLSGQVVYVLKDYEKQKNDGVEEPVWDYENGLEILARRKK